jgi:hypothetical protein
LRTSPLRCLDMVQAVLLVAARKALQAVELQ